jgi:hypothetical protein
MQEIQKPVEPAESSPASYVNPFIVALERKKLNSVHIEPDRTVQNEPSLDRKWIAIRVKIFTYQNSKESDMFFAKQ